MVERDNNANAVKLVGATQSFTWAIHPGDPAPTDTRVVLKFDENGGAHVLSAVQFGSLTTSRLDKRSFSENPHSEIALGK
jgi:hypothetical protein